MSSEDFRENHREGIDTTGGAKISGYEGRLSSLPNIIDPTTRMEHKRSKFSKKWATIDGSLGIIFLLCHITTWWPCIPELYFQKALLVGGFRAFSEK